MSARDARQWEGPRQAAPIKLPQRRSASGGPGKFSFRGLGEGVAAPRGALERARGALGSSRRALERDCGALERARGARENAGGALERGPGARVSVCGARESPCGARVPARGALAGLCGALDERRGAFVATSPHAHQHFHRQRIQPLIRQRRRVRRDRGARLKASSRWRRKTSWSGWTSRGLRR